MPDITQRLARRVRADFGSDADLVLTLLADLHVPALDTDDVAAVERVLAAVVLGARGDLDRLGRMADLATADWRDALMEAGLEQWDWPKVLDAELPT